MAKLWLTYAWTDNDDRDVDYIIHELKAAGLDVHYDRAQLLAGQRVWQSIDFAMNDPTVDAWAIFLTKNSLCSEPCQEEIAYALDRALRQGRNSFPLIGIFPQPIDRSLIPSAIATRLYVNLTAPDWKEQIIEGAARAKLDRTAAPPSPLGYQLHHMEKWTVLEVWPRAGNWCPFFVRVSGDDRPALSNLSHGPRGVITGTCMITTTGLTQEGDTTFIRTTDPIDSARTAHIFLNHIPSKIEFGPAGGQDYYELELDRSGLI
ncbi:MAG: toll/interleukin-1 receptor domain-containing protein [Sphingopyxis sp.]|nr:toll/interleukin-1 receptor domain-containing protein [Sphingopyxis sp.]